MNRSAYLFTILLAALALLFAANLSWTDFFALETPAFIGLGTFIVLAVASDVLGIDFRIGSGDRPVRSSISFLPLLACTVVFPANAAIVAVTCVVIFEEWHSTTRTWWITTFNLAQGVLSIGLAATAYSFLGGQHAPTSEVTLNIGLLPFVGLVVTFFLTNVLSISILLGLREHQAIREIAEQLISTGGNTLLGLLASPIAVFAAILYKEFYIGGLLLISLPLLLVRYSYLSKLQLQQANRDLLTVLVKAIETRDPYTSGHSLRVAQVAREIAQDLQLSRKKIEDIETAALLHDIGKIDASYAALISKPTPLSERERSSIRTHATKGADLLKGLASLGDRVIAGVRHHHERYDGSGYPEGLTGKAIPIAARIIGVCDAVDAMLSDRPYRPALTVDEVRSELRSCAGSHFDPSIVQVILDQDTLERAAGIAERGQSTSERDDPVRSTSQNLFQSP